MTPPRVIEIEHGMARVSAGKETQRSRVGHASRAPVVAEYRGPTETNLDSALNEGILIVTSRVGPGLVAFSQGILGPVLPGISRRCEQANPELLPSAVVQRRRLNGRC